MKVPPNMPKNWRTLVHTLEDWHDRLSVRVMHRIERMNRRMLLIEARGRSG